MQGTLVTTMAVRWSWFWFRIPIDERDRSKGEGSGQLRAVSAVRWSEMKYFRRNGHALIGNGDRRRRQRPELPLHAANLGNPIFVESWNGGSPLNWVEFMGNWETTRMDHHPPKKRD